METKQAVLPLSAPVSTSILLCFGNRHNHITVFDETIFVSSMTLYLQAMSLYIQSPLPCKSLLGTAQTCCSASADAGFAFLQNALSALRRNARPPQNRDYIQTSKFTRQNFNLVYEFGLYANKSTVCYGHVFGESGQEVFHLHCKSDNVFCRNKLIL